MALTQLDICNSALVKLGCDRITSIGQSTKSAIILNGCYAQIRDSVLRAHPWNFAIKRTQLTPTVTVPPYEYSYTYNLPSDYLRLLDPELADTEYVIENGKILANESTLNIRYIYQNTTESSWDYTFGEAMAWRLARELSYAMTQSVGVVEMCEKGYRAALAEARFFDAAEGVVPQPEVDDWTLSRR